MMEKYVLVLGSKPGSPLPDIKPCAIYSANGAAIRATAYRQGPDAPPLTAIVGSGAIMQECDKKRVVMANPSRVIARRSKSDIKDVLGKILPSADMMQISEKEQWKLQKHALGSRLYIAETVYETNWLKRIKHLLRHFLREPGFGVSTGLFAVLYAASDIPDAKIIISGIGCTPGGHFYNHEGKSHGKRAFVDAWMAPRFPQSLKARLYTVDQELSTCANIPMWHGRLLNYDLHGIGDI